MKRMIMAVVLLLSSVSMFAAEVKNEVKMKETQTVLTSYGGEVAECSMTLSATIGPSWAQVQVTCKGTASTCKEAGIIAKSCLDEAKNIFQ
jgi:hypothetical protein